MHPLLQPIPKEQLETLTKRELVIVAQGEQQIRLQMQAELERLEALKKELEDKIVQIDGRYVTVRNKLFGQSSEKSPKPESSDPPTPKPRPKGSRSKPRKLAKKLPSDRYPNVEIVEKKLEFEQAPNCRACGEEMKNSSMSEVSEYLTVIPKQYLIVRQSRAKYRCECCHGDMQTVPQLPRIKPGSSYSDELIIDAALSKFCDLIPMERYCSMASRQGLKDLPPNSLIAATHHLADFLAAAVEKVRKEVLSSKVLQADETPHRMLEGDKKSNWYLWGFSSPSAAYFECHDTRSGDVAATFLEDSHCSVLVSDVFSGYKRAIALANEGREARGLEIILKAYCNAHARRKFKESEANFPEEASYYLEKYREIYRREGLSKDDPGKLLARRKENRVLFQEMAHRARKDIEKVSSQSLLGKAVRYFLDNYGPLTLHLDRADVPIDNNGQERLLRNPVIGRKTWYGTHSKRGAKTTAMLFTLIESCRLNKCNPRQYFPSLVAAIHGGKPIFTPSEYKNNPDSS